MRSLINLIRSYGVLPLSPVYLVACPRLAGQLTVHLDFFHAAAASSMMREASLIHAYVATCSYEMSP